METKLNIRIFQKILSILIIMCSMSLVSQNDPVISQQGLQRFIYNPASTGTSNFNQIGIISRNQWNGFPDAPNTYIFTGHTFIPKFKTGIGIVAVQDNLGLEQNQFLKAAYSYHVWINEKNILSFGLSGGCFIKRFDLGRLILEDQSDYSTLNLENSVTPDFDFGIEYNRENFTAGVSATHIVNSFKNSENIKHPRHLHAYTQYNQKIVDDVYLKGIVSYYNIQNIHGFELSCIGEVDNIMWVGLGMRIRESFVLMGGVYVSPFVRVGYSYDSNTNILKKYSSGSHEVFLHLKFKRNDQIKSKSPRFFN